MLHRFSIRDGEVSYGNRFLCEPAPDHRLPDSGMPARDALNLLIQELSLDGQPARNLATFVTTWMEPEAVQVIYEDTAPPFNPYAKLPDKPIDITTSLERRAIGGLGVLLIKELAAIRDYAYVFGRNRIRLTMTRQTRPARR